MTASSPDRRLMTLLFPSFRQLQLWWRTPSFHTLTLPLRLPGPNHRCLKWLNPLHSPVNEPFKEATRHQPSLRPQVTLDGLTSGGDNEIIRISEGGWDVHQCLTHHQPPLGETHTVYVTGVTSNGCKRHLWLQRAAAPWGSDLSISAPKAWCLILTGSCSGPCHAVWEMLAVMRGSGLMMRASKCDGQISRAHTFSWLQ